MPMTVSRSNDHRVRPLSQRRRRRCGCKSRLALLPRLRPALRGGRRPCVHGGHGRGVRAFPEHVVQRLGRRYAPDHAVHLGEPVRRRAGLGDQFDHGASCPPPDRLDMASVRGGASLWCGRPRRYQLLPAQALHLCAREQRPFHVGRRYRAEAQVARSATTAAGTPPGWRQPATISASAGDC